MKLAVASLAPPPASRRAAQIEAALGQVLQSGTESARVRLAAAPETPAEVLGILAADPSVTVRAAVSMNPATPPTADRVLAEDADGRVRLLLGRKLAALAPDLASDDLDRAGQQALGTLMHLVEDAQLRVRAAIADVVKEMPQAPRELILRLARDTAMPVSEPILRLSPLLSDADLLAILAAPPHAAATTAIARRANLSEPVCEQIARTADTAAIGAMLANPSATIREATLDALIAQASEHGEWHEPLVHRPTLSATAVHALTRIVTTRLLQVLADRADLDPGTAADLKRRVAARLDPTPPPAEADAEHALRQAQALHHEGGLNEAALMRAVEAGDATYVSALLAVAARVSQAAVNRAAGLRNGKGLVSLIWQAGFTMRCAAGVQSLLGRIPPSQLLTPSPSGGFPLAPDDMRWQLDFLARISH